MSCALIDPTEGGADVAPPVAPMNAEARPELGTVRECDA